MSNDIRFTAISQHIAQPSITNISFKKVHLKLYSNLLGVNELTARLVLTMAWCRLATKP